jgi:hypothetical protein
VTFRCFSNGEYQRLEKQVWVRVCRFGRLLCFDYDAEYSIYAINWAYKFERKL